MKFVYNKKPNYQRTISLYTKSNLSDLKENLSHVPWESLLSSTEDIDVTTDIFTSIIKDEIKNVVPIKTVLIRPNDKPGMTAHVRKLFRRCHRLHKIAMTTKSDVDIENHKQARRLAKTEWKSAQKIYYEKIHKKMDNPDSKNKMYWKLTKATFGQNKMQSIPMLISNGITYTDDTSKATILNTFFAEQSSLSADEFDQGNDLHILHNSPELNSITIENSNILKILKSLNTNKSCGIDGIGNIILKTCADSLATPIGLLANASLKSGSFPSAWKKSNVVPIFKKGDKTSITNYRPISLLPCTSKVIERIVFNELYDHCMKHNLLSEKNSGFKKKDGTVNQLIHLTNKIYQGMDDGNEVAMIFLDLSKAYDRICHKRLLFKLKEIGIGGSLLKWFESYLSGRSQRVVYGGRSSEFVIFWGPCPRDRSFHHCYF